MWATCLDVWIESVPSPSRHGLCWDPPSTSTLDPEGRHGLILGGECRVISSKHSSSLSCLRVPLPWQIVCKQPQEKTKNSEPRRQMASVPWKVATLAIGNLVKFTILPSEIKETENNWSIKVDNFSILSQKSTRVCHQSLLRRYTKTKKYVSVSERNAMSLS